MRPLQKLVLEHRQAEEQMHPEGALLLIVEGQLKSQLMSGFVWSLMRQTGSEAVSRGEGSVDYVFIRSLFQFQGTSISILLSVAGERPNL